jgi:hypothetical protein
MSVKRVLMLENVVVLLMVCILSLAQDLPVIDLTNAHIQKQKRAPSRGMVVGGVPGGKASWPLQMRLISARAEGDVPSPALVYELELRNSGSQPIDLPVDPSPRDVEPADPAIRSYQYLTASIALEVATKSGGIKVESLELYGSEFAPGTSRRLAPGSAIRIRSKAKVMGASLNGDSAPLTISAIFALHRSFITGDTLEDRQIMGPVESSNTLQVAVH